MRLKLSLAAILIAGAAFAQPAPPDDAENEGSGAQPMQCVIDSLPEGGASTCDASPGPQGSPCNCPDAGSILGHREAPDD